MVGLRRGFGFLALAATIGAGVFLLWDDAGASRLLGGTRVTVIDGDSLRAGDENIRLVGIDAPELFQTCRDANGGEWQCGRAAKARLAALLSQGAVACAPRGRDRYGRTLAVCAAGEVADIGEALVREGHAVSFDGFSSGYAAAEREAREGRRGLWRGDFERPQDWRRRHPRAG